MKTAFKKQNPSWTTASTVLAALNICVRGKGWFWSLIIRAGRPQPDNREGDESCLAVLNNFYNDGVRWDCSSNFLLQPLHLQVPRCVLPPQKTHDLRGVVGQKNNLAEFGAKFNFSLEWLWFKSGHLGSHASQRVRGGLCWIFIYSLFLEYYCQCSA